MKLTGKSFSAATLPSSEVDVKVLTNGSDLRDIHRATIVARRSARKRNPSLSPERRSCGAGGRRRSRPETPLLKLKGENRNRVRCDDVQADECYNQAIKGPKMLSKERRISVQPTSVRKLAAELWKVQVPDGVSTGGERMSRNGLGFQGSAGPAGYMGLLSLYHHNNNQFGDQRNDMKLNTSFAAAKREFLYKQGASFPFPHSKMEGATKWDPICLDTRDEVHQIYSNVKQIDQQVNAVSLATSIELKLEEARACIEDLESQKRSQKKKLEQFLRKVSEERAAWRSREHEKVRAIIDDMKADMNREKKTRQRLETVNLKLVNELADSKLAVKHYMQDYQKERKARELIEKVCDELAKEVEQDKAEIEALKRESMEFREEVDDERKMLQMAEVWREERVQMKLIDAKIALEDKYSQMNKLLQSLEACLRARVSSTDAKEAREVEVLKESAASVKIQDIKDFTYEPPNPDDLFLLFEEMNMGESHDREIKQCVAYSPISYASKVHTVSPDANSINKGKHLNAFTDQNGDFDEDDRGWETVSHPEDHGSSCSHDGGTVIPSINNNHHRDSNVSISSTEFEGKGWEETLLKEVTKVCSFPRQQQSKKVSSIAKLWNSLEGMSGRLSNGRKSSVEMVSVSAERSCSKGGLGVLDLVGDWSSSPDTANANVNGGAMKGCVEWPRGTQKNSSKTKLIEAQFESQKLQVKHVLKHKS